MRVPLMEKGDVFIETVFFQTLALFVLRVERYTIDHLVKKSGGDIFGYSVLLPSASLPDLLQRSCHLTSLILSLFVF